MRELLTEITVPETTTVALSNIRLLVSGPQFGVIRPSRWANTTNNAATNKMTYHTYGLTIVNCCFSELLNFFHLHRTVSRTLRSDDLPPTHLSYIPRMNAGALILADCLGFRGIWNKVAPEKLIARLQTIENDALSRIMPKYASSMLSFGPIRFHLSQLSDTVALSLQ
jgi:hypothetical protein